MDTNCTRPININQKINKIITDLLFSSNLDNTLIELGELFKIILETKTFNDPDLFLLLNIIDEFKLSSPVLDILIQTIKYNSISSKILYSIDTNTVNNSNINTEQEDSSKIQKFQQIEKNPELKTKTIITIEKNTITGEETIIDKKIIKEPNATNLDGIFAGILQKEVKNEIEKNLTI